MKEAHRPKAGSEKIHSKDEFELCYLRHRYFRKAKFNPSPEEMKPFEAIATHMARGTYHTYKVLFTAVGFEVEDVKNIALVHLVSFLGLFSLEALPQKAEDFERVFLKHQGAGPESEDRLDKDKANFTIFLKQRMEELVRISHQKAKNIRGVHTEEFFYYCGEGIPPRILTDLTKRPDRYGYKKIDLPTFRYARKKANAVVENSFIYDGKYYLAIPTPRRHIKQHDLDGCDMNPRDSIHNMTPEEIYSLNEENSEWDEKYDMFKRESTKSKSDILKDFIKNNKHNSNLKEEIKTARKMLKEMA